MYRTARHFVWTVRSRIRKRKGIDLLQLLIYIAIAAILLAMATGNFFRATEDSKIVAAKADVKTLMNAVLMYRNDMGTNPTTSGKALCGTLQTAVTSPKNNMTVGPWISTCPSTDPWGNEYVFDSTNMVVYTQITDTTVTNGGNSYITSSDLTALQSSATGTGGN